MQLAPADWRRFQRLRWGGFAVLTLAYMMAFFHRMAIAVVNTGLFLGAAIMQPAFGWVLDLTWDGALSDGVRRYAQTDYHNGLWLSCGFAVLGLIAAVTVRETRCRNLTLTAP